jgi:hypothetical protein
MLYYVAGGRGLAAASIENISLKKEIREDNGG